MILWINRDRDAHGSCYETHQQLQINKLTFITLSLWIPSCWHYYFLQFLFLLHSKTLLQLQSYKLFSISGHGCVLLVTYPLCLNYWFTLRMMSRTLLLTYFYLFIYILLSSAVILYNKVLYFSFSFLIFYFYLIHD